MDDQERKSPVLPITGVAVLLAALGVVAFTQSPFKGTRPSVGEVSPDEKVRARLWQDPFQAVLDDQRRGKEQDKEQGAAADPDGQREERLVNKIEGINGGLTVLGVMVFGGPYAEDTEWRMRSRYAALSGLGRLGFAPEDAKHIEFIRYETKKTEEQKRETTKKTTRETTRETTKETTEVTTRKTTRETTKEATKEATKEKQETPTLSISNIVPYEWFVKKDGNSNEKHVLLLWINDDAFEQAPLANLQRLYNKVVGDAGKNITFKVIGPAGSTNLVEMLKDLSTSQKDNKPTFEIYSAAATADASLLLAEAGWPQEGEKPTRTDLQNCGRERFGTPNEIETQLRSRGLCFVQTINSDSELSRSLLTELELRGVKLADGGGNHDHGPQSADAYGGHRDHVALVAEWDTFYGRSLPATFSRVVLERHNEKLDQCDTRYTHEATWVHRFSYLRGLDGKLPGEKEEGTKNQKDSKQRDAKEEMQKLEDPTGKSQFDYVRRLTDSIYRDDQRLREKDEGAIRAIGVLGSDFYDKFLLLQALRQRFPEAVFFTTDLDARLLHPANFEWTRNLIVASNYPLELNRHFQGDVPPFRDNYQTSLFLSVLRAFDFENVLPKKRAAGEAPPEKPAPRVYEIGRNGAFLLKQLGHEHQRIEPERDVVHLWSFARCQRIMLLAAFLVILPLLLVLSSTTVKSGIKQGITVAWDHPVIVVILLGVVVLAAVSIVYLSDKPDEEPFSLLGGVSVWPTEIVRLITLVLSWCFIGLVFWKLRKSSENLTEKYKFCPSPTAPGSNTLACGAAPSQQPENAMDRACRWLKGWLQRRSYDWTFISTGAGLIVDDLWNKYQRLDDNETRHARFVPVAIFFLVFCGLIMLGFGLPARPVRGRGGVLDGIMIALTVISFTYLTFLVVDAARHCRRFIELASKHAPCWNGEPWTPQAPGSTCAEQTDRKFALDAKNSGNRQESKGILGELYLIRLIGGRTEVIGKFIFYPFLIWLLMFASRNRYFDNWYTPLGLAIVLTVSAVYAWSCVLRLRIWSERARTKALDRLSGELDAALAHGGNNAVRKGLLEHALREVKAIRTGSFAPLTELPVLRVLLIPFGGVGGLALLEYLGALNL